MIELRGGLWRLMEESRGLAQKPWRYVVSTIRWDWN
jgi:hypothetical protein